MIGQSDWEPIYDRGTGVYETRHTPPMFVFYAENERGQATFRAAAKVTREEAQADMDEHVEFHRKFWADRVAPAQADPKVCVIDGHFYRVGDDRPRGDLCGFGGRQFHIVRKDGTMIETHNLWSGGEIPATWREQIPDNAEFVNGERWVQLGGVSYLDQWS